MKLDFPEVQVETSEEFKTKNFGIGDMRVIINILRSKMYSNPIYTICQEIMSNSRDANIEAGRGDKPITIKLPNRFEPNLSFIDCGLGIVPDRIENVYLMYGNSTKRTNNDEMGGFGLGAKTPFAYTDTFTITTITNVKPGEAEAAKHGVKDIVPGNYQRTYIAFIGKRQEGSLSQTSCMAVDAPTGTTITVPVKKNDISSFVEGVKKVGTYWKVKPIVKGHAGFAFPQPTYILEGKGWAIENVDYYNIKPLVIIDGIPYGIDQNLIDTDSKDYYARQSSPYRILSQPIRLFFNVGDLLVTAPRDALDYQPEVIATIQKRLKQAFKELKEKAEEKIKTAKNMWEASQMWYSGETGGISKVSSLVGDPEWRGFKLFSSIEIPWALNDNAKITVFQRPGDEVLQVKQRSRSYVRRIQVNSSTLLVQDDIGDDKADRPRLHTLFDNNPTKITIGVVRFNDQKALDHFKKNYAWDHMPIIMLSSAAKKVLPKRPRRVGVMKQVKILHGNGYRGNPYKWIPAPIDLSDVDGGVYVMINSGKTYVEDKIVSLYHVKRLAKMLDVDVYGIQYKFRNKIGPQWIPVQEFAAETVKELETDEEVIDHLVYGCDSNMKEIVGDGYYNHFVAFQNDVNTTDSIFTQYLSATQKGLKGRDKYYRLRELKNSMGLVQKAPDVAIMTKLSSAFIKSYPIINGMKDSYYTATAKVAKEFVFYVNKKDEENV